MTVVYLLVPLCVLLGLAAVLAFAWAVRSGQFDDLTTPPWRALRDDEELPQPTDPRFPLP